ncbi:MAG: CsgG/HfaB family protein [Gemmatimonadales bacterium]|jgi:curli biogenesis system outer membrane secretion channel CsgG
MRGHPSPIATTLLAVAALSLGIAHDALGQKVRVAVLPLQNNSTWHYWGDHLGAAASDELTTQLVRSGKFSVIERQQLEAIMAEQNLGQSGRVNPATAAQLGEILGVQVVFLGSITQFSIDTKSAGIGGIGGSYSEAESVLDIRAVNTSTAEIMSVSEGSGKKRFGGVNVNDVSFQQSFDQGVAQEALRPAIEEVVEQLVDQVEDFASIAPAAASGTVVGVRNGSVYIDRGQNFGVEVGQRFDVYRVVDEIRDSQGNLLDTVTEKVGVLEVTRVLSQSAVCSIVEGDASEGDEVRGS